MIGESEGLRIARDRIAREAEEQTGFLDLGMLGLTESPDELFELQHLQRLNLGAGYVDEDGEWQEAADNLAPNDLESSLEQLRRLPNLSDLSVFGCLLSSLTPIAALTNLHSLECSVTDVSDLAPLASLANLQSLACLGTKVNDLAPLASLAKLQSLDCSWGDVNDLAPLACLINLQSLDCMGTDVSDLAPLVFLAGLQSLFCSETQVSDLAPLASLANLQRLNCSYTQVRDLAPLASLANLQWLLCSKTQVSDLAPLAFLANLQRLDCSYTQVGDLAPFARLEELRTLNLSGCRLDEFPRWLLDRQSLKELVLYEAHVPGVPAEVLSRAEYGDNNCLDTLRSHVRDLEAGAVPVRDVKLLVLGNGRVGKTQLCRRLRGEGFDETVDSTHGIVTTRAPLPDANGGPETTLQIWDFGGQDLYHGTHALFMRANAVFLLVWTPTLEDTHEETDDGITFRNHPLAYWVDYVRHLGGKRSAVVVVQTRCDEVTDEAPCPVPEADLFGAFGFHRIVRYSARTDPDRGRPELNAALARAAAWLREQEGIATIGAGRQRVKEKLEALRDAEAHVPPAERRHRTINQEVFHRLCAEAGGVSSPEHLLAYLHNAGIVFYREGLFGDAIILDQGWALDAIYAVFHREKSYTRIRRNQGRFTRSDLADWVWAEHGEEEQALFLSMMQTCGICFAHRPASKGVEAEFIAPDLLPERAEVEAGLKDRWEDDRQTESITFEYALLHHGLIRSIISRIGSDAGDVALYWRGGIHVREGRTDSRARIEAEMIDAWRGRITLRTQCGRAVELLSILRRIIEEEHSEAGLTPVVLPASAGAARAGNPALQDTQASEEKPSYTDERSKDRCVSYAWNDQTQEGREREAIVDRLCEEAKARGTPIVRDKEAMKLGDRISEFMQRIGSADVVFVILSDKYLKSTYCMYELWEVWRRSQLDEGRFLKRVRIYTLSCAKISSPLERARYAIHWKKQHEELQDLVTEHGDSILGDRDWIQFRWMKKFSANVGDILATVADTLQPKSFDELVEYGFDA